MKQLGSTRTVPAAWMLAAALALGSGAAMAHHGIASEFDLTRQIMVRGTIERVDWINPHIYLTVASRGADGQVRKWQFECVPVAFARKAGVTKEKLMGDGKEVQVVAFPPLSKDRPNYGFAKLITYSDGRSYRFERDR